MPKIKYEVTMHENVRYTHTYDVEAEDEDEAGEIAMDMWDSSDADADSNGVEIDDIQEVEQGKPKVSSQHEDSVTEERG